MHLAAGDPRHPGLAPVRYGITVPLTGLPLAEQREWMGELADLGYTDAWSSEVDGTDAFTPLVLASQWAPTLRLGTAVVPVFTRGPALIAQSAAALANLAPGRVALGVGTSSDAIVRGWNGLDFDRPYQRVRDTVRFLKAALDGQKVTADYETFSVRGFRLALPPTAPLPVLVGALRPGMLELAGREADGAVINWLSPADVRSVVGHVHAGGPGREIVARVFVVAKADRDEARAVARAMIAAYLNVPVYAAFHRWRGRGDLLAPMWSAWRDGDRKAALAAIPDTVVDDLVVHGPPAACRERLQVYFEAGVTTLAPLVVAADDPRQAVRDLAPR
ncbi:MAG: LLM class F420-dependent oxidoreductase [Acidimicrobiia bacterium]